MLAGNVQYNVSLFVLACLIENLSRFVLFVNAEDGKNGQKADYISFRDKAGFLGREEDYKSGIAEEARKALQFENWNRSMIGSGAIAEHARKSLSVNEIHRFIDYCKNDFLVNYTMLLDEYGKNYYDFHFKKTEDYKTVNDFFIDVDKQAYSVKFVDISKDYIDSLVREGKIYLFQIYNKDFSKNKKSNGTPNLHTLYFRMLFDEINIGSRVIALNGGAEMFYRKASISADEMIVHPKNRPVENKNRDNPRKSSTFSYDIVKNRRYTVDQFMLHVPITLNYTADGANDINLKTRIALRECKDNYVIGIDRGERNLLYICVINGSGDIVEQFSLNGIVNEFNGQQYKTDYHALLEKREDERNQARVDWKCIESIKELKEGYISQVVHKIAQLVEKYDAVIAMEDLNFGFKRVRGGKFERSVYQKFEKMMILLHEFFYNENSSQHS